MLLDSFPADIGLRILHHLSPSECQNILSVVVPEDSSFAFQQHAKSREATTWLYSRMFGNTSMIYFDSNGPPADPDFSATTSEMLARCQDKMFLANSPKHLSFKLIRDYQEIAKFQAALRACEKIIGSTDLEEYYASIAKISFHLNGRHMSEVCSTSLSVAISCLLLKLTKLRNAALKSISVVCTNIGDVFPEKWDKVFNCHQSIETLILDENCLKIPEHVNVKLEGEFKWPATLRVLSLAGNRIQNFNMSSMRNLPRGLESLNISRNDISFFGALDGDVFSLAEELPYMRILDLSDSRSLARVDPHIFRGSAKLPGKFVLNLSGCTLAQQNWDELEQVAKAEGFTLLR